MDYKKYIREHPEKSRCDFTKLFSGDEVLPSLSADLVRPFRDARITKVAAIDALGFVLGGLCAVELGCGLVLIRKAGKIAWDKKSLEITDYSGEAKTLELALDALSPSDKVLIVDDWSETGAQLRGSISLIKSFGADVVGAAMLHIDPAVLDRPELSIYKLHSVEKYN